MAYVQKVNVNYIDCETNNRFLLPALLTERGIIISHLRYLAQNDHKSESWKERSVYSLKLLLFYINATNISGKATDLLRSFTRSLVAGTIDYDKMNDPLNLFWKGRSIQDANNLLFHITRYTDFLSGQEGYSLSRINPFRAATSYEERLNWCAYYNQQTNVFLNHLTKRSEALLSVRKVRQVNHIPTPKVDMEKIARFPDEFLELLLSKGFVNKNKIDYKSIAITILLNHGGLRISEVFHIFVSDITLDPNNPAEALVRIYHPEYGKSPDADYKNRKEYLLEKTAYKPRNMYRLTNRLRAGWKTPLLTHKDNYFEVIFNPPSKAKEFLAVWVMYLKHQRVEPAEYAPHPFAFTNTTGRPETIKNFQRIHKRAVERIGLISKKEFGTTEHGHRHAYGYRARKSGLEQIEIQKAMHHKNPSSCLVYINPTSDDLREQMRKLK